MDIVIVGSLAYDDLETDSGSVKNSLGGSGTFAGSLQRSTRVVDKTLGGHFLWDWFVRLAKILMTLIFNFSKMQA